MSTLQGNQQFKGMGISRWCALCGCHRGVTGSYFQLCFGGKNWVCAQHPRKVFK